MKRFVRIFILSALAVLTSCIKEADPIVETYPEGTPVTLNIGFGAIEQLDVQIGTKAGATIADESRVHDLYVLIFDKSGKKFYGRYFTYEHMISTLATLDSQNNEGWYVENTQMSDTEVKTKGVVKISTESKSECTLVLLANVSNAITKLNGKDPIDCLAELSTLNQLNNVQVTLEQQTVNRNDLFLMMGTLAVNTGEMVWGELPSTYNETYKVPLRTLDAKIQFRITYDTNNIDSIDPRYWQVYNVPSKSYLTSHVADPTDVSYFNTSEAYFEDVVTENTNTYHVFTFYMLENRPAAKANIEDLGTPNYYLRDTQEKVDNQDGTFTNGDWVYAPDKGTYVKFNAVLHLTNSGIDSILGAGSSTKHALTSDGLFYVHLGDFTSSDSSKSHNYDDYTVNRGYAYTYNIKIINSTKIYVEVCGDDQGIREDEAGQEGSLLLTSEEIINCDAHYEYHSVGFKYDPHLAEADYQKQISWHIKTPFAEGGPEFNTTTGWYDCPADMDIAWVKFGLNGKNEGKYKKARAAYPGINETTPNYYPEWYPGNTDASKGPTGDDIPALLDVNQLINLLIDQSKKRYAGETNLFDSVDSLRFTAFIDEYYYEKNPISGDMDPDLWRSFVNASPRELHILANAQYSADQQSDVITSSHSIIQQSIQTIYNIYSPNLSSIWGTEHLDEMKDRVKTGWPWTRSKTGSISANYCKDSENGRYNTAALWGLNPTNTSPQWNTFLNYEVDNDEPELNTDYQGMAFSCMTRNRDNDGDGVIDPEELRWYLASINQLIGMWVGNESLSPSARIYQPANEASNVETDWRAHVVSSTTASITGPRALVGEEGVSIYTYDTQRWDEAFGGDKTDATWNKVQSVRCVRNIGTYKANGKTTDISYAPFDTRPDQYFEAPEGVDADNRILPNDDGTYTLRFTNLNTRSLREYTSEDLPFHSEYSKHNCVYLELHMQNPTVTAMEDNTINVTMLNLNKDISSKGYNEYCPTGYRLPNMTELAMMQAWLPSSYWPRVNNTRYGEAPCRTYYAKGYYCSKNTFNDGVPTTYYYSSEADKVGWTYNRSNMHLSNVNAQVKYVRCVRDKNLTGDITGKVSVPDGNALTVGTPFEIDLNFSSMASALTDLALYLVYTTTDGVENTLTIPSSNVQLSGVTLRDELTYTIPDTVPILGSMAIRAVLRNSAGISRSFETEITVLSPVTAAIKLLNVEYDKDVMNPPFPVLCTTSSPSSQITKWTLSITDPAGEKTEVVLPLPDLADKYYRYYTYNYDYGQTLQTGVYTFQLETEIENGPATRSAVAKMEILKEDFWPNPTPTDQLSSAADVTVSWGPELIDGIDFSAGDFIETTMDLTNCIFKVNTSVVETATEADEPTEKEKEGKTEEEIAQKREEKRQKRVEQEHRDTDLGLDNLFSIGIGTIGWYSNTFHLYYPAHDNNLSYERMLFRPQETDGVYKQYPTSSGDQDLNRFDYRIDKTGIYWNNQKLNLSDWDTNQRVIMSILFNRLITSTSLYIGSTEGKHRSRAGYRFVRVVYNGSSTNIHNDDYSGDFDADPIDGGNL